MGTIDEAALSQGRAPRPLVMFVIPSLSGGGAERVVTTLLKEIDRQKFRLALVVLSTDGARLHDCVPRDVEFRELGARRLLHGIVPLVRQIWTARPDVVFSTLDHMNLAIGLVRPLLPRRTRLVVRITDLEFTADRRLAALLRLAFRRADAVVSQSQEMDGAARRLLAVSDRGVTIRNPLAISEICARSTEAGDCQSFGDGLVAAGRLVPAKGFDLLIRAVAELNSPHIRLDILGEGPEESALRRLIEDLSLGNQVRLLGFQSNPYRWFRQARGFVLSSRLEGFPNVVLEALACGTPVLATPLPGIPALLDGIPGCTVARDISVSALTDAMRHFLAEEPRRVSGDAVRKYSSDIVAREYESLFERVLGRGRTIDPTTGALSCELCG